MKNYIIECEHDVYIKSYSQGEQEYVNYYNTKGQYEAESAIEAIEKHINSLGYDFEQKNSEVDEEEGNKLIFTKLVDSENNEATDEQIKLWQKDELKLFDNNLVLCVYELIPAKI